MGSAKGGSTIGYHYLGSVLFGIGRGPVNCLTHIRVGDKIAWEGGTSGNAVQPIDKPDLFGGEKKEGGIQGLFRCFMGSRNQVLPGASAVTAIGLRGPNKSASMPDIKALMGGNVGEMRGRHMVFYDGLLSSMTPYIKEWSFRRWRTTAGWYNNEPWYPAKATIYLKDGAIRAMNAAHIIYQCITDPALSRGRSPDELEESSFVLTANTLCSEQFGLCLHWQRSDDVGPFIQTVIDHIGGVLYTDRETGLINLKLIRGDYDPADLPHFDMNSGLLSISEDDSGSSDAITDEVIVTGKDPITDQAIEGRSHNLAVRRFRGGATTAKVDYPGLPTIDLCNRVAQRDRDAAAAGLRKFTVKLDRAGYRLHPGAVFKVSHAARGLDGIVLRAGEIDDGNMVNGEITVKCVQDVFSLPLKSFVTPVENTYSVNQDPMIADAALFEGTYRDLYRRLSTGDMAALKAGDAMAGTVAARPNVVNTGYDMIARAEGDPAFGGANNSFFTANGKVTAAITATDTAIVLEALNEWDTDLLIGAVAFVDGEYMGITAWDAGTSTATVKRGCVDTWPRPHEAAVRFWLTDDDVGTDKRWYLEGETVQAKVLTKTGSKRLAEADAPQLEVELKGRPFRPYPPADVKVDGVSIYATVGAPAEPAVTWVERNRLTQADTAVGFFDATVAHEDGTTYRIKIYGSTPDDPPINTYDGITSGWVYDATMQTADGTTGAGLVYARLFAVRDGVESLEQPGTLFALRRDQGYGINYGNNYGGDPAY